MLKMGLVIMPYWSNLNIIFTYDDSKYQSISIFSVNMIYKARDINFKELDLLRKLKFYISERNRYLNCTCGKDFLKSQRKNRFNQIFLQN